MVRTASVAIGLAILSGCGDPKPIALRVDLPLSDADRSVLVGVEAAGGFTVHASPISPERTIDPIQMPFSLDGRVEVTALLYEETLEALDLPAGALEHEEDPALQVSLPNAERVAHLTIADGLAGAWDTEAALPEKFVDFRVTGEDVCGTFAPEVISLGEGAEPTFVLAVDPRWVIVGTSTRLIPDADPAVFAVDLEGNVVRLSGMPSSFFDGYQQEDGTIWLGGEAGVVYRASFSASPAPRLFVTVSSTVSSGEDIISLVGPKSGSSEELFALTTNREDEEWGAFEWFDGERWVLPGVRRNTPHDATWVSPGYGLFASFFRDGTIYGARDGTEIAIEVTSVVFGSVVVIEQMPGLGLVAGTSGGELHLLREDAEWAQIAGVTTERIDAVHRYPGGLIYTSGNSLYRWVAGEKLCAPAGLPGYLLGSSITTLGEDVIIPLIDPNLSEDQEGPQQIALFHR